MLRDDPVDPRITYYDDATGERIELSAVTLANWAAKTGNLLRDELAAGPFSRVAVLLPAHWQTAAVLFGLVTVPPVNATVALPKVLLPATVNVVLARLKVPAPLTTVPVLKV